MLAGIRRTVNPERAGIEIGDPAAHVPEGRGKAGLFVNRRVDGDREQRPRRRNTHQLAKRDRPDMTVCKRPRTDHARIDTVFIRQTHRQIRISKLPVNALFRGDGQHLVRDIDRVDRPDPPPCQRLGHKTRARADIQHRADPAGLGEGGRDSFRAKVVHSLGELRVIALRPAGVIAPRISGRLQRIGAFQIVFFIGHAPMGPWPVHCVKRLPPPPRFSIVRAMSNTLLSLGHGYTAAALTRRLGPGWTVIGTTRRAEKAERLRAEGVEPRLWPGEDLAADFARVTHVLCSISPDAAGDPVLVHHAHALAAAAPRLRWVGYLSTTGVYGDHDGGWVDEATPLAPTTERGRRRVLAERQWQALAERAGLPLHIFRLAGIYGPGRGPFEKVRDGTARRIVKPGQYFSRIHVDDIAAVLTASISHPDPGAIYNVADDDPSPPEDVLAEAARLLGLPVPPEVPFDEADMTPLARSFYAESKRIRNDRIKNDLGVVLTYPDYRSGLARLLEASGS